MSVLQAAVRPAVYGGPGLRSILRPLQPGLAETLVNRGSMCEEALSNMANICSLLWASMGRTCLDHDVAPRASIQAHTGHTQGTYTGLDNH